MKQENKTTKTFSFKQRIKSFTYAFNGLKILLREEHNAWIHLAVTIGVIISGFVFHISGYEWMLVILCIGLVFAMETVNSAIENIADFVSPQKHETIKKVKDLMAAAVLLSVIASAIVGLMVFLPKFWDLIKPAM